MNRLSMRTRLPFAVLTFFALDASAAEATAPVSSGSFQMLFGLIVVLGLMVGAAWLLKRFGPARMANSAAVKIVGGVSVGNRERIVVVEVADQWIVVGIAPGRINALSTMPRQENVESTETMLQAKNFSAWLKQTIDKRNGIQ